MISRVAVSLPGTGFDWVNQREGQLVSRRRFDMFWSLKHSARAIVALAAVAFGSSLFVACGSSNDSLLGSSSDGSAKGTPGKLSDNPSDEFGADGIPIPDEDIRDREDRDETGPKANSPGGGDEADGAGGDGPVSGPTG